MQPIRNVIIAAAGMGNRLGYCMPKCLVDVLGRKIIEYQLELLKDIPNVRIVVGYQETQVMNFVKKIRKDIVFVRNPAFKNTTTLQSLYLGVKGLQEPCIIMDGDTIFERESFNKFLSHCEDRIPTLGVSSIISTDPVYADSSDKKLDIVSFSRNKVSKYEWANIALVVPSMIENKNIHVYQQLSKYLPLRGFEINRLEIDTEMDLINARNVLLEHPLYV